MSPSVVHSSAVSRTNLHLLFAYPQFMIRSTIQLNLLNLRGKGFTSTLTTIASNTGSARFLTSDEWLVTL